MMRVWHHHEDVRDALHCEQDTVPETSKSLEQTVYEDFLPPLLAASVGQFRLSTRIQATSRCCLGVPDFSDYQPREACIGVLDPGEREFLNRVASEINNRVKCAAKLEGATFVDVNSQFTGKLCGRVLEVCQRLGVF